MIRVLVADDQAMVRGAIGALLELEGDITIVASVGRGDEVVDSARDSGAEICLLDVQMPGMDGLAAAAALREALPGVRVLMLTTFDRPGYLRQAMDAGAQGFLVKDAPAADLARAVRNVHAGGRVVDADLAKASLADGPNPLSPREQQILRLAQDGRSVAAIAQEVFLSPGTVRNHLSAAIGKLGTQNRVEAAERASQRGWI